MIGGEGDPIVGDPIIQGAVVNAEVIEQTRAKKIIVFKKKRRHNIHFIFFNTYCDGKFYKKKNW